MNQYQQYYVYYHVCPKTDKIMYIGQGQYDRAWCIRTNQRNAAHVDWLKQLYTEGYTADQIVVISDKKLSKEDAKKLEREYIIECDPIFNDKRHERWLKENQNLIHETKWLREDGLTFTQIADELKVDRMKAWRMAHAY